jgi:multiple sugar transport system permease protein
VSAIPVAARPSSPRLAARARTVGLWLVGLAPLVVAAIIIVAPVLWTVSTSLRTPAQAFTNPPSWFPTHLDWSNYATVFTSVPYASYVLNSAIVSVSVVVGQLVTAGLAGYAFARLRFPGKNILFWVIMATLMIPLQATIIPVFELISKLHLNDTLISLIVPAWVTPFGVFLLRQYFMGLPHELEEAAVLDGAGPWQVFRRVYLPLGLPGFAILAILSFNGTWNDYFRPLIFLTSQQHFTVPLGVVTLFGYLGTGSISVVLAGVVLSIVIVLVVYLFGQRYLLEGLTAGSLKS